MNYIKFSFNNSFFNIKDTLDCGQIFRYVPFNAGYKVFSLDKCAYCYEQGENVFIECLETDKEYFFNFFDLDRDYSKIYEGAMLSGIEILKTSASLAKGVRILNQDTIETLFSFIISQNNNIPRIKGIIERLCREIGEKREFLGETFYSFPSPQKMAQMPLEFFKGIGLGYRAEYVRNLATDICSGLDVNGFSLLDTKALKGRLTALYGVGRKVCDCVSLFGFHRSDSFPVDTWIEKVYKQDFNGKLQNRDKIADWFVEKFGINAGYYQQYLFYYKRSLQLKD